MGRPVVLSNGQLFVGLNESGLVHDFYYPYVGLENLTNARNMQHKIGVWVDGVFSWTDDGSWDIEVDFEPSALVSNITMHSKKLKVGLQLQDFVDIQHNSFVRRVHMKNLSEHKTDIRLFMHQVFQISRAGRGDTAFYVPGDNYIFDYKGRTCLLISGAKANGESFDQFAIGNYGIEGKAGTFMDAEDGQLSGNAVEHGGVDSVIGFSQHLGPMEATTIDYWIIAANNQNDAASIHQQLKNQSREVLIEHVHDYFYNWLSVSRKELSLLSDERREAVQKSLLIIKAHTDIRGSVLASGDSSIFNYGRDYYCYCWPRDAAYAIWPLIRLGYYSEAKRFFEFARDTMHPAGYLMHKYQPDRAIGSTWHPLIHNNHRELAIQEDETAIVLFMMAEYYQASGDDSFISDYYADFIMPCANFMTKFIDEQTGLPHASYDLWEQKFQTSTYTACTVIAALQAAAGIAKKLDHPEDAQDWQDQAKKMKSSLDAFYLPEQYLRKGFYLEPGGKLAYDDTIDISSLYGAYMFAKLPLDDMRLLQTSKTVEKSLANQSDVGGVIRYENDDYFLSKPKYKGNPWPVCTLWLAQYYLNSGERDKAEHLIEWVLKHRQPSGTLSEQYDPETGESLGVTPLVWSHAELINTILDAM